MNRLKQGDLKGVYYREGVGNIDLVWGDEGGGFEHILKKHIGEGKSFANVEEAEKEISNIINNGVIDFENGDRIVFKINNKLVTIRKNYRRNGKKIADKNWVLTAYDEMSADSESPVATIQDLAGLATDNSISKDSQNSPTDQTNPQESSSTTRYSLPEERKEYVENTIGKRLSTRNYGDIKKINPFFKLLHSENYRIWIPYRDVFTTPTVDDYYSGQKPNSRQSEQSLKAMECWDLF